MRSFVLAAVSVLVLLPGAAQAKRKRASDGSGATKIQVVRGSGKHRTPVVVTRGGGSGKWGDPVRSPRPESPAVHQRRMNELAQSRATQRQRNAPWWDRVERGLPAQAPDNSD